ncbi:aminophospholipid-translocating P4-type ATPase DRS2 [Sugiyamaella lignohabitans]|uniref:Aminophospholipid-translocating P4-type ATPase DRS2 n=1 Tax=Sugiyamaella lignohabitans TaxID=796027 RepID=A0A167E6A8_9ASCO|nr:aminophospholipid-translocating P4-type ATPase DRS2 [Sugiyamaella lignohabitans]ANB13696.1 aminophospholipid-translocating P4-type ATPase DRS2 [Sugiyamaella lignohabitans]
MANYHGRGQAGNIPDEFSLIDHPSVPDPEPENPFDSRNASTTQIGHTSTSAPLAGHDEDLDLFNGDSYHTNTTGNGGTRNGISASNGGIQQTSSNPGDWDYLTPVDSSPYYDSPYNNASNPYLDGTGIVSGHDQDDFIMDSGSGIGSGSGRHDTIGLTHQATGKHYGAKGGISGFYSNVRSKLGLNPAYTEMDLPLTEHATAGGAGRGGSGAATGIGSGSRVGFSGGAGGSGSGGRGANEDRTETANDYDIRKFYYKLLGKKMPDASSLGPRIVTLNDPAANQLGYKGNHISTTKYNAFTFIPKFLFEQFSKYANLFFLCTALIQQVPNVTPTNRYTTIGTLAVVLLVSAFKELVEDVKRSNADKELNNSKVEVLNTNGEFETRRWVKLSVGDIVRIKSEEPFPADILLLASSEPEGLCYIETANLDGETNLKIKQSRVETSTLVSTQDLSRLRGRILSEQPNSSLYTYEATLELTGQDKMALAPDQLLLRGATLRNTPWIHGVVVFTGHETKLMRNATAAPIKRTAVEHMINLQIIFLFSILLILAIVSSMGNVIKIKVTASTMWYLQLEGTSLVKQFFQDLLTYWVLFSNLVPIR